MKEAWEVISGPLQENLAGALQSPEHPRWESAFKHLPGQGEQANFQGS